MFYQLRDKFPISIIIIFKVLCKLKALKTVYIIAKYTFKYALYRITIDKCKITFSMFIRSDSTFVRKVTQQKKFRQLLQLHKEIKNS